MCVTACRSVWGQWCIWLHTFNSTADIFVFASLWQLSPSNWSQFNFALASRLLSCLQVKVPSVIATRTEGFFFHQGKLYCYSTPFLCTHVMENTEDNPKETPGLSHFNPNYQFHNFPSWICDQERHRKDSFLHPPMTIMIMYNTTAYVAYETH